MTSSTNELNKLCTRVAARQRIKTQSSLISLAKNRDMIARYHEQLEALEKELPVIRGLAITAQTVTLNSALNKIALYRYQIDQLVLANRKIARQS